jgi:hypothetical protein
MTPSLRRRLVIASLIAVAAAGFALHQLSGRGLLASDFQYDLRAAHQLLAHGDPYADPHDIAGTEPLAPRVLPALPGSLPYPLDARFPYPLNAALLAIPFTVLDPYVAGAVYVGILAGLMAFALTREGYWRLAAFASPSYFVAASVANWSPLIVAAAFLPLLYPFAIAKPNIALPVLVTRPHRLGYVLCAGVLVLTIAVMPDWPLRWASSLASQVPGKYLVPLAVPLVLPVLLALFWWRHSPARFLLLMAITPQHPFFYDQLLLWLIPKTLAQSLALSAATWVGYLSWSWWDGGDALLAFTPHGPSLDFTAPWWYLSALAVVAWQMRLEPLPRLLAAIRTRRRAADRSA